MAKVKNVLFQHLTLYLPRLRLCVMGKVTTKITATNYDDLSALALGARVQSARVVDAEALIDTGATSFYLQQSLVQALGLRPMGERSSRTMSNRRESRRVFSPVKLEIQGRNCLVDVVEIPDELPNIVGQVPLEILDWVVDAKNRMLIGNPDHGGVQMMEEFGSVQLAGASAS